MITSLFFSWPTDQDAEFRAAYEANVGEYIQDDAPESGGRFAVGSSRARPEHFAALKAQGFDVVFSAEAGEV